MDKMNKPWKRKPSDNPNWKEFRIEDIFQCHHCKEYYPWMHFGKGKILALGGNDDNTYKYLDDSEDRGGRRWACDTCIDKILYNNKLITITDTDGKIINIDIKSFENLYH